MRFSPVHPIVGASFLALALLAALAGCRSSTPGVEAVARPEFNTHDRVALVMTLDRETEDLFIPLYMEAFPGQVLVERRDVSKILGEQDVLPDRLDEATRAKLRKILGVKAIVYARCGKDGFALKVIDTDTGAITASVFVEGSRPVTGAIDPKTMVRTAISALEEEADDQGMPAPKSVPASATGPIPPIAPPAPAAPRD